MTPNQCPVCTFAAHSQEALAHHVAHMHFMEPRPHVGYPMKRTCWCGESQENSRTIKDNIMPMSTWFIRHLLKHGVVEHFAECALGGKR